MSDIPSGWYPDPDGLADERYHDGTEWTSQTRSTQKAAENAPPPPPRTKDEEEQRKTQRATMHYVRSLAILAALFVYLSVMSAIVGLAVLVANVNGWEGGGAFAGFIAFIAAITLIVGLILGIIQFISAFQTANKLAD